MTAFVLGNGVSRSYIDPEQLARWAPVYGCNALYRTFTPTVLVATDQPISREIQESHYGRHNRFYTRRPMANLGGQPVPRQYFGFSSGPIAAAIAAMDFCSPIYLLGFDLGPDQSGRFNNIFAGTEHYKSQDAAPTYTGNWVRQLCQVFEDFKRARFVRVMGPTTAEIEQFDAVKNFSKLDMQQFRERINTGKDL